MWRFHKFTFLGALWLASFCLILTNASRLRSRTPYSAKDSDPVPSDWELLARALQDGRINMRIGLKSDFETLERHLYEGLYFLFDCRSMIALSKYLQSLILTTNDTVVISPQQKLPTSYVQVPRQKTWSGNGSSTMESLTSLTVQRETGWAFRSQLN